MRIFLATASAVVFTSAAFAEAAVPAQDQPIPVHEEKTIEVAPELQGFPSALQKLVQNGMGEVVMQLDVEEGVKAFAFRAKGNHKADMFYQFAGSDNVIVGNMLDENGMNMTMYHDSQVPEPDYSQVFEKLKDTVHVATGEGDQEIWVVYEPNCGYCQRFHDALEARGTTERINWLPVSFLRPDSWKVGAAWSMAPDKAAFLKDIQGQEFRSTIAEGVPDHHPMKGKIMSNFELAKEFGISGTPALLYKNAKGEIVVHRGMVQGKVLEKVFVETAEKDVAQQ